MFNGLIKFVFNSLSIKGKAVYQNGECKSTYGTINAIQSL